VDATAGGLQAAGAVAVELSIILALILANGFFAGAEIAIIAAGRGRLRQQAEEGNRGAQIALELASDPNRFLPTVQVGITLIGTFAAAFGGARLGAILGDLLKHAPISFIAQRSQEIALTLVVLMITYLSVVLGELVPKRLALHNANQLAGFVSRPMHWLAIIARPAVWFMGKSTQAVLWLLRVREGEGPAISVEDIQHLIESGGAAGVIDPVEQRLAVGALRLGESTVSEIMRPRLEIDAVDVDTPSSEVLGTLAMAGFSKLPVYEGNLDRIIGYIHLKDVVRQQYLGWKIDLRKLLRPVLFVPGSMPIDKLLVLFQEQRNPLAIVLDEFGGTDGMVTLEDVLEVLVGKMLSGNRSDDEQLIVPRDDNSWLVDGRVNIDDLAEHLSLKHPDLAAPRNFNTVAGLILAKLDRIPVVGESVEWLDLRFEVVDMDGPRIDRLLVSRKPPADNSELSAEGFE